MQKAKPTDIFEGCGEKVEMQKVEMKKVPSEADVEGWIDELVGTITDPIIVYPSPWVETLPKDVMEQVTIERLLLQMQYVQGQIEEMTATDAEALLYLYPACLEFPFTETWTQIYVWLGARVCGRMGRNVPEDLSSVVLTHYQEEKMKELKRCIYHTRVTRRKEKLRGVKKAEKKEQKEELAAIQHSFDLFGEKEEGDE